MHDVYACDMILADFGGIIHVNISNKRPRFVVSVQ